MADNYVTGPASRTIRVLSPTAVADVERVPFVTKPSGVSAWRYVPYDSWLAQGADPWIGPLATAIEGLISGGLASYGAMIEDVDPATNLIADFVQFTVAYTSPDGSFTSTTTVDVPVNLLTLDTGFFGNFGGVSNLASPADMLRAAYDRLAQTAAL